MRVLTEYLTFHTKKHREYIHITPQVEAIVAKSGVKDDMTLVSAMHITAGVYVNDNESGLIEDIDEWLEKLAPFREHYRHHETGEDNGDSHLKALAGWPVFPLFVRTATTGGAPSLRGFRKGGRQDCRN